MQIVELNNKITKKVLYLINTETHDRTVKQGQNANPLKTYQSWKRKVTPLNLSISFLLKKNHRKQQQKQKQLEK